MSEEKEAAKRIIDDHEDGLCPDCGEAIKEDIVHEEECEHCGHIFHDPDYLISTDPFAEKELSILGAFEHHDYNWPENYEPNVQSFYEHGQWFVKDLVSGACWSCHDCVDEKGEDGLCFEQVSEGEFE